MKKGYRVIVVWILLCILLVNAYGLTAECAKNRKAQSITIKIGKATKEKVVKLDAALQQKKKVVLIVKGDKPTADKTVRKMRKIIKKVNRCGVVFERTFKGKKKGKCIYWVSKREASDYSNCLRFIKRIESSLKEKITSTIAEDESGRVSLEEIRMRARYSRSELKNFYKKKQLTKVMQIVDAKIIVDICDKAFCELSDVEKVVAIGMSGYFGSCRRIELFKEMEPVLEDEFSQLLYYDDEQYHMCYSFNEANLTSEGLADGICRGVCSDFASQEWLIWKSLGLKCYYNNGWYHHAWSVVVAKNSEGKELWIPFDYGIHFCIGRDRGNSYSRCWKMYVASIKGAPKKINYSYADFY